MLGVRRVSTQQKLDEIFETKTLNYERASKLGIKGESKININDIDTKSEQSVSEYEEEKFEEIEKGDVEINTAKE